ncbi:glycoside hydrolase family 45 protein [Gautieria morchelliformis]|nr:glycoside hydrolase family 45 protein [Gautieria morchelliformis]
MSKLSVYTLLTLSLSGFTMSSGLPELTPRGSGGYVQNAADAASFTVYSGCGSAACGVTATGFTTAMNQLSFGAAGGEGAGDACGRCFAISGKADPYSPSYPGPFSTIVVKVTDLCPLGGNEEWCGQTQANPLNRHGQPVHFDLCSDTGASAAFFPPGRGALTGAYTEVPCSQWSGYDGSPLWNGACISGESAPSWPAVGCGNQGTAP